MRGLVHKYHLRDMNPDHICRIACVQVRVLLCGYKVPLLKLKNMSKAQATYLIKDLQSPNKGKTDSKAAADKAEMLKKAMASDSD